MNETLDHILSVTVGYAWGAPLLILLVGGGFILTLYSRFLPFVGMRHAFEILRGKFYQEGDPGDISHFQALSTHLAATVGLGNIGGVAIAITQGGPGAVFWMWVSALVGMATKFFTCTLAVMYRSEDSLGQIQGGPMYYIEKGLGKNFKFMAIFFSVCGMLGCLAMFQANQVAEILDKNYAIEPWQTGLGMTFLVGAVVLGGIKRIAKVASQLVPAMCSIYLLSSVIVVISHYSLVPQILTQIFHDAFTGTAATGGIAGISFTTVVQTGIKRAAFSNEAGIGTAPMAHGATKTTEPVREGLVGMIGPFIDTIIVCTLTALVILSTGNWKIQGIQGVSLTSQAFGTALGSWGELSLMAVVLLFGVSTMFGYSYYGKKCFSYLFGAEKSWIYNLLYLGMLFIGATWSASMVINLVDTAFALMALPNMIATLLLAPKVMAATKDYLARYCPNTKLIRKKMIE
ncbi:MAG: alanine/glycine:cation symporter family protein [Acidobacteriota bacterium]|nr:alanine/glycine:cation symporter family protein [Acidobacteriota bacterium]